MGEFLCTSCGKTFSRKASLHKHFSAIHKQETCTCKECGKVLRSKKQLVNHPDSHIKISCIGCNKLIAKNSRASHDCGETVETFTCDQCLYETKKR